MLDETADFVALPMYDGELGVLPGRAPLIGRLGRGELRLTQQARRAAGSSWTAASRRCDRDVVTVLTARAVPADDIDPEAARQELTAVQAVMPKSAEEQENRRKAEERARAMIRIADRGGQPDVH